jgi:O-antigen/teichoic acid export membrane protein
MATGSVLKGSAMLIVGRVAGMAGSLFLFLLLTWRSKEVAGVFRIAVTYFILMDFLPLLGMHRWIAAEIAHRADQQLALFRLSCAFATGIAILGALVYLGIAYQEIYGPDASNCLNVVALTTIPSAINLCTLTALIGLGHSHEAGYVSIVETFARSALTIPLVLLGADVFYVIIVFLGLRCAIAAFGYFRVSSLIARSSGRFDRKLAAIFLAQVPNLALSTVGYLVIRNVATLLLPLFHGNAAAGLYAAPFQLFDLLLLPPTILTISTNYLFSESYRQSMPTLRRRTNQLIDITAAFVLPLSALAIVLARPIISTIFGNAYDASVPAFQLLMVSAIVVSLDQILALSMAVAGRYQADRNCLTIGALTTVIGTYVLSVPWSTTGAAAAFLIGTTCTLLLRFTMMRWLLRARPFAMVLRHQFYAAFVAAFAVWVILRWAEQDRLVSLWQAIALASLGMVGYLSALYLFGGLTKRRLTRAHAFLSSRH